MPGSARGWRRSSGSARPSPVTAPWSTPSFPPGTPSKPGPVPGRWRSPPSTAPTPPPPCAPAVAAPPTSDNAPSGPPTPAPSASPCCSGPTHGHGRRHRANSRSTCRRCRGRSRRPDAPGRGGRGGHFGPRPGAPARERTGGNPCGTTRDQRDHDLLKDCDHCRGQCNCEDRQRPPRQEVRTRLRRRAAGRVRLPRDHHTHTVGYAPGYVGRISERERNAEPCEFLVDNSPVTCPAANASPENWPATWRGLPLSGCCWRAGAP
ncbi:hypothetical protein SGPA1_40612 [Streptomyces misionensis JCM 4497]